MGDPKKLHQTVDGDVPAQDDVVVVTARAIAAAAALVAVVATVVVAALLARLAASFAQRGGAGKLEAVNVVAAGAVRYKMMEAPPCSLGLN